LVDSEVMAGLLQKNNYEIVAEPADADVVMVNTCGFIGAAKEESIDTIVEMGRLKESGKLKKLVVAGCLPSVIPPNSPRNSPRSIYLSAPEKCRASPRSCANMKRLAASIYRLTKLPLRSRDAAVRSTPTHTAFVKVSEGCDHKCAFCIIPQLRGPHRSRSIHR
jgi:ribosomal protein S12 methylthiotransferase